MRDEKIKYVTRRDFCREFRPNLNFRVSRPRVQYTDDDATSRAHRGASLCLSSVRDGRAIKAFQRPNEPLDDVGRFCFPSSSPQASMSSFFHPGPLWADRAKARDFPFSRCRREREMERDGERILPLRVRSTVTRIKLDRRRCRSDLSVSLLCRVIFFLDPIFLLLYIIR